MIASLAACTHETTDAPKEPEILKIALSINFLFGAHTYDLNGTYADDFGHLYKLDELRFFLSSPYAVDDDSNTVGAFASSVFLVSAVQDSTAWYLGPIAGDHVHELYYDLGVDSSLNHGDPMQAAPPMNDTTMYDDLGSDYYFLSVRGRVDSNNNGTIDAADSAFTYRCAGDPLRRPGSTPMHELVAHDGVYTAPGIVDVAKLLFGIDLLNTPSSSGNGPLQVQLMDNLVMAMLHPH